eukprot:SAG31_NODE_440_length_15664_cov_8.209252_7_plen_218_part_00
MNLLVALVSPRRGRGIGGIGSTPRSFGLSRGGSSKIIDESCRVTAAELEAVEISSVDQGIHDPRVCMPLWLGAQPYMILYVFSELNRNTVTRFSYGCRSVLEGLGQTKRNHPQLLVGEGISHKRSQPAAPAGTKHTCNPVDLSSIESCWQLDALFHCHDGPVLNTLLLRDLSRIHPSHPPEIGGISATYTFKWNVNSPCSKHCVACPLRRFSLRRGY